jgi:microcystin-dependent protein
MSEPFLAEVKIYGLNFAPRGWAFCDGQIMSINQNQSLYSLLGTTYGGDGRSSFGLPDMRGRVAIGSSTQYREGSKGGQETHTLTASEMPTHSHTAVTANEGASSNNPTNMLLGNPNTNIYGIKQKDTNFNSATLSSRGGSQPHNNMQPFLAINYCIALQGIFPSRN